ncbi:hypothetical protein BDZ91DRAFT_715694 [Kalaharituber pfeilii]|nr:hypothetical protein BDZ91DRAFT_715694 [Kalaharituber pfeilii]
MGGKGEWILSAQCRKRKNERNKWSNTITGAASPNTPFRLLSLRVHSKEALGLVVYHAQWVLFLFLFLFRTNLELAKSLVSLALGSIDTENVKSDLWQKVNH